ncbi:MAG TPA: energy transducer TonB, partial [Pyrinomonadaceae bacterium]|nr:energy transducer TonB [Pyrinomonadaceae bacterium]
AIATLGFGEIIYTVIRSTENIGPLEIGQAAGLHGIPKVTTFFWAATAMVVTVVCVWRLAYSSKGKAFAAIREDEVAAAAMGINTTFYKSAAFVIGAFFAGVAGALFGTLRVYGRERRPAASPSSAAGDVGDAGEGEAATTKARMSKNPEPEYSKEAREDCISGLVRLRAVLASDGTVKHILPVKRLGYGLTQRAIEAARGIKFTPARKGGRPVSQFVLLEYNFACY